MNKIQEYLDKKKNAWSPQTIKTAASCFNLYGGAVLTQEDPAQVRANMVKAGAKPYTITTYFAYLAGLYSFCYPNQENVYDKYRKENRKEFKNSYTPKRVEKSYEEVKSLIEKSPDCEEKIAALYLLKTAQRVSEARIFRNSRECGEIGQYTGQSCTIILGKGGKRRANLGDGIAPGCNYYRLRNWLKDTARISPHGLRKLALTRAAERGATAADLCEIAGWSSINTAYFYLQPKNTERLKKFLE